jgi:hypothetical protein
MSDGEAASEGMRPSISALRRGWAVVFFFVVGVAGCAPAPVYAPMPAPPTPTTPPAATVFLLGDGGAPTPGRDAVLGHLATQLSEIDGEGRVAIVYLGDNIYEVGARATHAEEDRAKLEALIAPLSERTGARAYFAPGNHDWGGGASNERGAAALALQGRWIGELAPDRATLLPTDGCAGPTVVDVTQTVHLVFVDTEAILREVEAPCPDAEEAYAALADTLRTRRAGRVLLLSHHPLRTGGKHGGHVSLFSGFPTLSYLAVKTGVERQDLRSARYRSLIDGLIGAFEASGAPPLVVASGHEHTLQVIRDRDAAWFQLVSGSLAKSGGASRIRGTRFASGRHGYMRLDFRDADVRLTVFAQSGEDGPVEHVFSCTVDDSGATAECPEARRGSSPP